MIGIKLFHKIKGCVDIDKKKNKIEQIHNDFPILQLLRFAFIPFRNMEIKHEFLE